MIVASIDLMGGEAVQLVGGKTKVLGAGDPRPWAEKFAPTGEIAVVDLDAALGRGDNATLVRELCSIARCRVGGGIRDVDRALEVLDTGAEKVVIGTRADPEFLARLPRERVIAALDCIDGEVVVDGWRTRTGVRALERMRELEEFAGGFLVTFVEREGRMIGLDHERTREFVLAAGSSRLTVAGGVNSAADVARADRAGADAQVGMALYTGALDIAEAFAAPLSSDRADGLWPTIVADENGHSLGLVYSNLESLRASFSERCGVYWSRTRGLWRKGESSGDRQELVRVDVDCDRDALRFVVRQSGRGFCHTGAATCFGGLRGLRALERRIAERRTVAVEGSYTAKLLSDRAWLDAKLVEEAGELALASTRAEVVHEAADLVFFAMCALSRSDVSLSEVERELDRRSRRISRRGGGPKPRISP